MWSGFRDTGNSTTELDFTMETITEKPFQPGYKITILITIPAGSYQAPLSPARNTIGLRLLAHALTLELSQASVTLSGEVTALGELNCSLLSFTADDLQASVRVCKNLLQKFQLLDFAELGWADKSEMIYRQVLPRETQGTIEEFTQRVQARLAKAIASAEADAVAFREFIKRNTPET